MTITVSTILVNLTKKKYVILKNHSPFDARPISRNILLKDVDDDNV